MVGWFRRRLGDRERGAALAEFGIVAIMLFVLVFGLIEFGRYTAFVEGVNMSTREGARFASATDNLAKCAEVFDHAKALSSVANLENSDIDIEYFVEGTGYLCPNPDVSPPATIVLPPIDNGDEVSVTVTVTKDFSTVAPIVASIVPARTITSVDRRSIFIGAMGAP